MKFEVTPEEAQQLALVVIRHLKAKRMNLTIEKPAWPGAPYRTTLVADKSGRKILVEAQSILSYSRSLKEFAAWLAANRHYAELHVATSADAVLAIGLLYEMKLDGVGLMIVNDNGSITEHHRARNPALVVTPDPTLSLGPSKAEVKAAVGKFNETDRKDGLRDMCEIIERLTEELGAAACRKTLLKIPEGPFKDKDWASQINELARTDAYNSPHRPIVGQTLKDDLHSFRGARNLVDHNVGSRQADKRRQMQFAERMMQGPRLAAELLSLKRKIR